MSSILITCNEAKIEALYQRQFSVEVDGISNIDANIDDILSHLSAEEIAKSKNISDILDEIDDEKLLDYIGENSILDYISNNSSIIQKFLDIIDDKYIIGQARKIKIEKLKNEE